MMPRSVGEILQHVDALGARCEDYETSDADELDAGAVGALRRAVPERD